MENVKSPGKGRGGGLIAGFRYPAVPVGKIESDLQRNKNSLP
jgi:hypothetical protein